MHFTSSFLLIALACACAFSSSLAYPYPDPREIVNLQPEPLAYSPNFDVVPLHRVRRQFQLNGGGGGSPKQGFDLNLNARAPVWQSHNGRHSFDATGSYGQHLGGPYGNSRPQFGAGGVYTYRF
ncbi:diptericin-A [Drosophila subpulchrella]|uniref:diptericin-A n=1 Tax=Drosophila subpulchrella TaxID=1486046 RepID=UPI0018A1A2D3|nr:diptericin-A [Drosophila subpulchrella]